MDEAVRFCEAAGLEVNRYDDGFAFVQLEDQSVFDLDLIPDMSPAANHAGCYIITADVVDWHARLVSAGLQVSEIADQPWGMRESHTHRSQRQQHPHRHEHTRRPCSGGAMTHTTAIEADVDGPQPGCWRCGDRTVAGSLLRLDGRPEVGVCLPQASRERTTCRAPTGPWWRRLDSSASASTPADHRHGDHLPRTAVAESTEARSSSRAPPIPPVVARTCPHDLRALLADTGDHPSGDAGHRPVSAYAGTRAGGGMRRLWWATTAPAMPITANTAKPIG